MVADSGTPISRMRVERLDCTVNTRLINVRLREMMEAHRLRTGERLTYGQLAERTGVSKSTLESLAARPGYNASLSVIERICRALGCAPGDLLALDDGGESAGRS